MKLQYIQFQGLAVYNFKALLWAPDYLILDSLLKGVPVEYIMHIAGFGVEFGNAINQMGCRK